MRAVRYDFDEIPNLAPRDNNGPIMTCSRTAVANVIDFNGYYREAQSDEPRFQGAVFKHNIISPSNDFSLWTDVRATEASGKTDPFGGTDAWAIVDDATASATHGKRLSTTTYKGDRPYVASIYARASALDHVSINMDDNAGTNRDVPFDLSTGTIGTYSSSFEDAGIKDMGNGWYRCWVVSIPPAGTDNFTVYAGETVGGDAYNGDLGREAIEIYQCQIEDVGGAWDAQNLDSNSESASAWQPSQEGGPLVDATNRVTPPREIASLNPTITELRDDNAGGTGTVRHLISESLSVAGDYLHSFYIKKEENSSTDWISIRQTGFGIPAGWVAGSVDMNISTGLIGVVSSSGLYGIQDKGDGWYRIFYHWRNDSADLFGQSMNVYQKLSNGGSLGITPRDNTRRAYVCGAMLERLKPNQTLPSPYLPTIGEIREIYTPSNPILTTTDPVSNFHQKPDGLRREQARTNELLQSKDFTAGDWTTLAVAAVVNGDLTYAPDGSLSGDQLVDDASTGTGSPFLRQNVSLTVDTQYCYSIFMKADRLGWGYIAKANDTLAANCYFDLINGTVGTQGADTDGAGIRYAGDGWWLCWIVFTTDAVDADVSMRIFPAEADTDNVVALDGTSSIFLWQADLTEGAHPSTPIYTQGISVTRDVDVIENIDSGYDFHNSDNGEMSVYLECIPDADGGDMAFGYGLVNISTNGGLSGLQMYDQSAGVTLRMTYWNGGLQGNTLPGSDTLEDFCKGNVTNRFAVGVQQDNMVATCYFGDTGDQGLSVKDTNMNVITGSPLDSIRIGRESSTGIDGIYQKIHVFDKRLSDKQLLVMGRGPRPPILPGGRAEKTRRANDAALWNKMMNARTEDDSDGEYKPWANIG
jgi:hypothetical protein